VQLVKPSPAGELFALSPDAIAPCEACALLLGAMVDIVRELTRCPLTTI
jgi:hypothetical protein